MMKEWLYQLVRSSDDERMIVPVSEIQWRWKHDCTSYWDPVAMKAWLYQLVRSSDDESMIVPVSEIQWRWKHDCTS